MITEVTNGIQVSVDSNYQPLYSRPEQHHYFFSYRIQIENKSDYTVKLMRRHWFIFDSSGNKHEVEGEGVVGQQPELQPGESYTYESACNLTTEIGSMHGIYTFLRTADDKEFQVTIPRFQLISGYRLN